MRSTIQDHIKNNSGSVVPLEKDADYLVADHARKDAPSGSISWKFITESVENGVVQLPDRYKIAHAPATPRHVASGRPVKHSRATFTEEEDAVLASWVLAHDSNQTGNEIYKQLETMHPRHTWQSWRNRYVKKLIQLPHASLLKLASKAADGPSSTAVDGGLPDQELPDPTELMLQRKGQRVQQETALQRTKSRAIQPSATTAQASAPPPPPTLQQPRAAEEDDASMSEAKKQFYEDLQMFCEDCDIEFAPTQQVAGLPVDLWELSKAVSDQRLPAEEIDWPRVAEELGYEWTGMEAAVRALQRCYEKNLAEFLDLMEDAFGGGDNAEDPESAAVASQEVSAHNMPASPREQLPSSPPARFLPAKRPIDADGELEIPTPVKRRRLYIPPEIPSTPEAGRRRSTPNTSKRHAETTTPVQFETQIPNLHTHESSFDMTPSQQLQSEYINSSPIPLRLNSAVQNRHIGAAPKHNSTSAKRRVLPKDFKPRAPPAEEREGGRGSVRVLDDKSNASFPGALPSARRPPPPIGPPAQAAPRRLSKKQELSDLIQHYESLGYAHKTVIEGLQRTTMAPGLATVVMQSLQEGKGVPAHHEGIWTARDDTGLRLVADVEDWETTDGLDKEKTKKIRKAHRARDRLRNKHGEERMALRLKYLRANDSLAAAANE
ncbi:uncharacterized protein LMH87_009166 [Akanthomyces muscarius]|uniref:DNA-binding protein RAP1 n=1 Tax=Akanthomyces muscarius TaxID=2231603 RepID=A0A9W8QKM9_AKAMU|nr:uncharacterized protein LMH87_009166 [Akanthomyces muscarius]KAJ4158650.1 hypothetical protein LMH87_009166 [Akanthomyces muscarius]